MHARNSTNGSLKVFPLNKESNRASISLLKEHPHNHGQRVDGIQMAKAIHIGLQMEMRNKLLETGGKVTLFKSQELNCVDNVLVISGRTCKQ